MQLLDCTLRDGANVVGKGFSAELTDMMLSGLIRSGIKVIEYGNSGGIGAYEVAKFIAPLTDREYLDLARPYLKKAEIGMFLNAKRYREKSVALAAENGLSFLRIGADAGDAAIALEPLAKVKEYGLKARYSMMKAYLLTPEQLAEEAKLLESKGLDEITIMDSAGAMTPEQAARYSEALSHALSIPVGFHGHNNLGLSIANALAAAEHGARVIDCGLLGMARSAGNIPTEAAAAVLQHTGLLEPGIDLYGLLRFLDEELIPAMKLHDYRPAITPIELILGYSGCHSSFLKLFARIAAEKKVSLYRLIVEVSAQNRKNPSEELILSVAETLPQER
ncbi:MAG TPA: 4-hydroxy-2-oxovalerate aldolase [Ruminococcaceae bacterium]|nr:4-hydroxy-2-oxovalerate aldolase [Oscillospiraceae bacterium]